MSKAGSSTTPIVQKICTLWTHDESLSREEAVINIDKFPELGITSGSLVKIIPLKQSTSVRDFHGDTRSSSREGSRRIRLDTAHRTTSTGTTSRKNRTGSATLTFDENGHRTHGARDVDSQKTYIFVAKSLSQELRAKYPQLQVSVSDTISRAFGFRNRMQVVLSPAEDEVYSASHVEISFRDEYLSRADMWRFAISEMSGKTVYRGQKLLFMGTIKATIKNVFVDGQPTHSGYFSPVTKPIFRSESARFVLFIQMSKEMWNFDTEGTGEIMFNKVINGFLPDLFKRWMRLDVKHLVTIILFTRMHYDRNVLPLDSEANGAPFDADPDNDRKGTRDFYKVVVSEMASCDWINILYQLKKEFRAFLRDVCIVPYPETRHKSPGLGIDDGNEDHPEYVIAGTPTTAVKGNILEAINLAAMQYSKDYIDRDLVRTGISAIIITPGTGLFEVDYSMLKLTTETLLGSGIGIDLVSLQPMPLHSVPLFKYRNPRLARDTESKLHMPPKVDEETEDSDVVDPLDESTPRQNYPNFGPLKNPKQRSVASLAASPAKYQSHHHHHHHPFDTAEPQPGDWSYAMPYWLDISFWTGTADEIFEITNSKKGDGSRPKIQRKKKGFQLRCRMYELQMMGVMENEMSNIALPYLQESPMYPWSLLASREDPMVEPYHSKQPFLTSANASPKNFRSHAPRPHAHDTGQTSLQRAWMDTYDDHVFKPLPQRQKAEGEARQIRQQKELEARRALRTNRARNAPSDSLLSASFNSHIESLGSSARPPKSPLMLRTKDSTGDLQDTSKDRRGTAMKALGQKLSVGSRHAPEHRRSPPDFEPEEPHFRTGTFSPTHTSYNKDAAGTSPEGLPHTTVDPDSSLSPRAKPSSNPNLLQLPETVDRGRSKQVEESTNPRSTNSSATPKAGKWLSRHISFTAFGFGPSKAAPSIEVSTGKVAPAALTRKPSQHSGLSVTLDEAQSAKRPSQPIEIQSRSRQSSIHDATRSSMHVGSAGTPKDRTEDKGISTSHNKDPGSLFLLAGSRGLLDQVGPKINLSSSGDRQEIPRTLSPTSALAPWMVLVNPCNPKKNHLTIAEQFRRWHHVFPYPIRATSMKWKSLCSPAAVPLTNDYFPTAEQLATEYNENPYRIIQNEDDEMAAAPKSRENLIRELIAFRLSHGFQIVVGPAVADVVGKPERELANVFAKDFMAKDGSSVFMCVGNTIHQLVCVSGGEVEVKRFNRKPTATLSSTSNVQPPFIYKPLIRTALDDGYAIQEIPLKPRRGEFNWNFIDSYLAGYEQDFSDTLRFWRARFVLIPVDIPPNPRRRLDMLPEDSDEEIRLEGIRKLTQVWQRYRYVPPEERQFEPTTQRRKDTNPLAIEYQTRDPSAVIAAGPDGTLLAEGAADAYAYPTGLFAETTESYLRSNYDLNKLAQDLQGEKGIQMTDRRWHLRLHLSCFVGFDLTTWLIKNFKDVETREQAVELGNELMRKGLFQHVQKKHHFRDGNFFYHIASEYRLPRSNASSSWMNFSARRSDKSVPSTPVVEPTRSASIASSRGKSRPSTSDSSTDSGEKTPTKSGSPKKRASLSNVMRIDVDVRKRSYRPEIINLHYDRLHNPDNCYHIRIDWMNVTAKLIEDAINTWASNVEKYGLRLVELPIAEASDIGHSHPFRSPYMVRPVVPPPKAPPAQGAQFFDGTSFGPSKQADKFAYHKAILKKLGFVLDMEAASCFPADVDVTYSWGRPDYRYTQFIHKTGVLLAQITHEGEFLLLANRLCNSRGAFGVGLARDSVKFDKATTESMGAWEREQRREPTPIYGLHNPTQNMRSPFASPMFRPVPDAVVNASLVSSGPAPTSQPGGHQQTRIGTDRSFKTAEQIKDDMEALCLDERALRQFYAEEAERSKKASHNASPSPRSTPVLESSIPTLGLPPNMTLTGTSPSPLGISSASPSPSLGAALIPPPQQQQQQQSQGEEDKGGAGDGSSSSEGGGEEEEEEGEGE
ncbi:uncharacterized protein K452DRAFT_163184 [Aplosporella prunicola CBS 121167]|uniref:Vacuolar membrane-associated protein IML1 n=1 Tax=Aplosporella prunicola CBS 121167 TaxID=1176127 RepID=A0A6A6BKN8_9PEZI|nr:uncharacterized protein K452DRAFT_163184 [Aplosporella prunicola CBS 121167]KAF2143834.1 hypothetical protein K452DRAFT_163184 [Aplosporella prunicola CBS 121167]